MPKNPLFDETFYAEMYPDLVDEKIDLHHHYSTVGCRVGYDPNAFFDSAWYIAENLDVADEGANPLDHYLVLGATEGRDPSPLFSGWLYLILYPDVRAAGVNPLLHFLRQGRAEGRLAPSPCLLPSLEALHGHAGRPPLSAVRSSDTQRLVRLIRDWTETLLIDREIRSDNGE